MRKQINSVYREMKRKSPAGSLRLVINERIPYVVLESGKVEYYYSQGDEAADFLQEIEAAADKFKVTWDAAAVWLLESAGAI